jgi:DNA-binding protein YbaB
VVRRNLDEADEWIRSWTARASARAEAAQRLSERVSSLSSTVRVADGAITVTVSGAGLVTGLELDDRVRHLTGRALSEAILGAIGQAQAGLTEQVTVVVQETVGMDSETGQAVVTSFERRFPATTDDADD